MLIDKLKSNPSNPRTIGKKEFVQLKKKIKNFPAMLEKRPIVYDKDFIVLGGNQRLRVLKELIKEGFEVKDSYFKSAKDWTKKQKREFVILDNIADGDWDYDLLANEWSDLPLEEWGIDTGGWGEEVEEDEPPELDEEGDPVSKLDKVYKLGRHRLMCGDATKKEDVERLMDGKKADMVFTDPPYGIDLDTDWSAIKTELKGWHGQGGDYSKVIGDDKPFDYRLFEWIECKEQFWWGANYYAYTLPDLSTWFVWDKRTNEDTGSRVNNRYGSEFEMCWSKNKHRQEIVRKMWSGLYGTETQDVRNRIHPTQKPIEVCSWFIKKFSKPDNIVLDLFGGSGSTLIACEQTNRICYMMELDPRYVDVIRKRYANFIGRGDQWQKITPKI